MDEPHRASASDLESLELPQRLSTTTGSSSTERRSWGDSSRSNGRYEEHQLFKLQLVATRKQLKHQEARAAKAEEELVQATAYLKRVNDARLVALQEAAKAKEELVLYKLQLQRAQEEIFRAQRLLEDVDLQRHDAQREASEAKTLARRLNRDLVVRAALEEGRRLGLQEGLERARAIALKQQDGDAEDEYYENEEAVDARSLLLQSSEDTHESSHSAPSEPPARTPTPPSPPPDPVPVPEVIQHSPSPVVLDRPTSFHKPPSPSHYAHFSIPPDGYIPSLDADHIIRMPAPHSLSRPPPTPDRVTSPPLSQTSRQEEPLPVPRRSYHGHQRNASQGSTPSLSQLYLENTGAAYAGRHSPLSAIPEVQSVYSSPNPQSLGGNDLGHQSSLHRSSHYSNAEGPGATIRPPSAAREQGTHDTRPISVAREQGTPYMRPPSVTGGIHQPAQSLHRRPSTSSSVSRSLRPPQNTQEGRKSSSSASTVPPIEVLPPSSPASPQATPRMEYTPLSVHTQPVGPSSPKPTPKLSGFEPNGGTYSPAQSSQPILVPMPGAYQGQGQGYQTPQQSVAGGLQYVPVNGHHHPDYDDVASNLSHDTLTTPPPDGRPMRHTRTRKSSVDMLMTPPPNGGRQTGWEDAVRMAASPVPIPFDNMPPRKPRPLSRSTNRSGN